MGALTRGFGRFVVRDAVLTALGAGLLVLEERLALGGAAGVALAVVVGVAVVGVGFLAHEWGHWFGARLSGGVMVPPRRLSSPFLFAFDTARSDRRQFLAMSVGGYVATVLGVAVIAAVVDLGRLSGQVAIGLAGLAVLVTFAAELPTTLRVARGGPLPTGGVYAGSPPGREA